MIKVTKSTSIPSAKLVEGILTDYKKKAPTFIDLDKLMSYWAYYKIKIKNEFNELNEIVKWSKNSDAAFSTYASDFIARRPYAEHLPLTKGGKISVSSKALKELLADEKIPEEYEHEVRLYIDWSSQERIVSAFNGMLSCPISASYSYDKHRMLLVNPIWVIQNTGRIGQREPAIQNLARVIQDVVTVPYGYVLIHCDSGQMEPREAASFIIPDNQIKYLINLYDDAYYGLWHYAMMLTDEDISSGRCDFKPYEITDDIKSNRKEIKTYSNAVLYGSESNRKNSKVKAALIKRYGKHPLRLAKLKEIEKQVRSGNYIFPTYFGTPIDISKSDKLKGKDIKSEEGVKQCLKLGINNPIQGTAADLMRMSCVTAHKLLQEKCKDSYIIDYIHDAGRFMVSENEYDKVADELKDIVAYDVPGWVPIKAEAEVGRCDGLFEDLL